MQWCHRSFSVPQYRRFSFLLLSTYSDIIWHTWFWPWLGMLRTKPSISAGSHIAARSLRPSWPRWSCRLVQTSYMYIPDRVASNVCSKVVAVSATPVWSLSYYAPMFLLVFASVRWSAFCVFSPTMSLMTLLSFGRYSDKHSHELSCWWYVSATALCAQSFCQPSGWRYGLWLYSTLSLVGSCLCRLILCAPTTSHGSTYQSVGLSVCLFVCVPVNLSACLFVWLSVCLSVRTYLSVCFPSLISRQHRFLKFLRLSWCMIFTGTLQRGRLVGWWVER